MLLTKKELRRYLQGQRLIVPKSVEQDILLEYGQPWFDDEGHLHEYTEQDLAEQLRKIIDQNVVRPEPYSIC